MPVLVPVRRGLMLVSAFTFDRGAALPMAADLAGTPASGLRVQLCGDAHLSSFGAFASPGRRLVFSVNDLDETLPGTPADLTAGQSRHTSGQGRSADSVMERTPYSRLAFCAWAVRNWYSGTSRTVSIFSPAASMAAR